MWYNAIAGALFAGAAAAKLFVHVTDPTRREWWWPDRLAARSRTNCNELAQPAKGHDEAEKETRTLDARQEAHIHKQTRQTAAVSVDRML
jgi:hypothetical protein